MLILRPPFAAQRKRAGACDAGLLRKSIRGSLKVEFEPKLKLSSIVRGSGSAVEAATGPASIYCVRIPEVGRSGRFIKSVKEIEALRDKIQPDPLAKPN